MIKVRKNGGLKKRKSGKDRKLDINMLLKRKIIITKNCILLILFSKIIFILGSNLISEQN